MSRNPGQPQSLPLPRPSRPGPPSRVAKIHAIPEWGWMPLEIPSEKERAVYTPDAQREAKSLS